MRTEHLVDNFFRHEYGRMVATLARRVGVHHIDAIEDAVQSALLKAVETWAAQGVPSNPSAWLFRVASNDIHGQLRTRARRQQLLDRHGESELHPALEIDEARLPGEVHDDLLRMLFVCCDDAIPVESQLVLALKTLCGFDVSEIAQRLFTSESNVYKRLERARKRLRHLSPRFIEFAPAEFSGRLQTVLRVLYLLFTEGHFSSRADLPIRRELCDEAVRLATVAAEHPSGRTPETCALLALMHLHLARMSSREDLSGGLLLLEEQNRDEWDQREIELGLEWLAEAARGENYSRYHAEAAIAAEHCIAPSFSETRWDRVVASYELLEGVVGASPLHVLNRAVAVAEWKGPEAGLDVAMGVEPPKWLEDSYIWPAVLADLHRRCGDSELAAHFAQAALEQAPSEPVRDLLRRRLEI